MDADTRKKLRQVDVCFVIDTTASMGPYIDNARNRLKAFAQALTDAEVRPQVAFAVVAYRDHPPQDHTYVTQVHPLSEALPRTQVILDKLRAEGGGDEAEAVLPGVHDAVHKIPWRNHAHKVILLVGDAPPHGVGEASDAFPDGDPSGYTINSVSRDAKKHGIIVYGAGVVTNKYTQMSFSQIAKPTGGRFVSLEKVNDLINSILGLMQDEFVKMADDIAVYDGLDSGSGLDDIALRLGKSAAEVTESVDRLRTKDALPVADPELERRLRRIDYTRTPTASTPEVDSNVLDQISLLDNEDPDEIEITMLD